MMTNISDEIGRTLGRNFFAVCLCSYLLKKTEGSAEVRPKEERCTSLRKPSSMRRPRSWTAGSRNLSGRAALHRRRRRTQTKRGTGLDLKAKLKGRRVCVWQHSVQHATHLSRWAWVLPAGVEIALHAACRSHARRASQVQVEHKVVRG